MMKIPLCQPFSQTLCAETGLMQKIQPMRRAVRQFLRAPAGCRTDRTSSRCFQIFIRLPIFDFERSESLLRCVCQ